MINYWQFDENGNWFIRNSQGRYASSNYSSFNELLEANAQRLAEAVATAGALVGDVEVDLAEPLAAEDE
jgi:hypothetical protein